MPDQGNGDEYAAGGSRVQFPPVAVNEEETCKHRRRP